MAEVVTTAFLVKCLFLMISAFIGIIVSLGVRSWIEERTKKRVGSEGVVTLGELEERMADVLSIIDAKCTERRAACTEIQKMTLEITKKEFSLISENLRAVIDQNRESLMTCIQGIARQVEKLTLTVDVLTKSIHELMSGDKR